MRHTFKLLHEKGSCDQESVVDKRNKVATWNGGRDIEFIKGSEKCGRNKDQ